MKRKSCSTQQACRSKGAALLREFRGAPPADVASAVQVLLRIQRLTEDYPEVEEVEVNPLLLSRPGGRSVAVDARLRIAPR